MKHTVLLRGFQIQLPTSPLHHSHALTDYHIHSFCMARIPSTKGANHYLVIYFLWNDMSRYFFSLTAEKHSIFVLKCKLVLQKYRYMKWLSLSPFLFTCIPWQNMKCCNGGYKLSSLKFDFEIWFIQNVGIHMKFNQYLKSHYVLSVLQELST